MGDFADALVNGLTEAGYSEMICAIVLLMPEVPGPLLAASLFFPVYYTLISLVLNARRRRS